MLYFVLRSSISLLAHLTLRCRVVGRENVPQGGCIIVANHVNLLDSPIIGVRLGRRVVFMAKEEVFRSPVWGFLIGRFGAFPVAKGRLDRRAGKQALEALGWGEALVIFPEGKRSPDGRLGPAYSGAALLATRSGVPVVPVGITGTSQLVGKGWFLRRPKVVLSVGRPFTLPLTCDKLARGEIVELTRRVMVHLAAQLPPEYRGRYADGVSDGG